MKEELKSKDTFMDIINSHAPYKNECSGIYGKLFGHYFIPIPKSIGGLRAKSKKCIVACQRCGKVIK